MANVLDTLLSGKKVANIPQDGEQFPSMGFIGPVTARMLFQFMTKLDLSSPQYREEVPQHFYREQFPSGTFRYYYTDKNAAGIACKADTEAYAPQQVWYYSIPIVDVMNIDTSNWQSNTMSKSCRMVTLRSKYRHEFHMIALPAIVAALAKVMGLDVPEFDIKELLVRDVNVTAEMSRELVGIVATDKGFEAPYYEQSSLWAQRAAIWKALGEDDPNKYLVDAFDTKGNPHEYNTEAPNLKKCLGIYSEDWEIPLYSRLQMVADPRITALSGGGKRLQLPAITEIFATAADAQAAVDADRAKFAKDEAATVAQAQPAADGKPALPADWVDMGEEKWRVTVLPFTTMPKALLRESYDPDEYGATLEQMMEWVEWEKKVN